VSEKADKSTSDAASILVGALNDNGVLAHLKSIPAQDAPNPAIISVVGGKNPSSMQPIEP
jgi:hypothetical protein